MIQNAAKPGFSNVAAPDMFVPVQMRSERAFGIVGVDYANIFDAQRAIYLGHRLLQARRRADIVAGRQAMAGIDAESDFQIGPLRRELAHRAQLFETAAQRSARSGSIFE